MRVFAWPRSPRKITSCAGQERVLELRQHGVLVARGRPGRAARPTGCERWRCAAAPPSRAPRSSPTRGADRPWRGRDGACVMGPTYRRARRHVPGRGWRRRSAADHPVAVRLRLFVAMWVVIAAVVGPHGAGLRPPRPRRRRWATRSSLAPDGSTRRRHRAPRCRGVPPARSTSTGSSPRCSSPTPSCSPERCRHRSTISSERGFGNGGELTDGGGRRRAEHRSSGTAAGRSSLTVGWPPRARPRRPRARPRRVASRCSVGATTPSPRARTTSTRPWPSARPASPRRATRSPSKPSSGSLFEARGDASILFGPDAPRRFVGPGKVILIGTLEIANGEGTHTETSLGTGVSRLRPHVHPRRGGRMDRRRRRRPTRGPCTARRLITTPVTAGHHR